MAHEIRMGIPEMDALWNNLKQKHREGTASKKEEQLYKKWGNALKKLAPHPEDNKNGAYDRINLSDVE